MSASALYQPQLRLVSATWQNMSNALYLRLNIFRLRQYPYIVQEGTPRVSSGRNITQSQQWTVRYCPKPSKKSESICYCLVVHCRKGIAIHLTASGWFPSNNRVRKRKWIPVSCRKMWMPQPKTAGANCGGKQTNSFRNSSPDARNKKNTSSIFDIDAI